MQLIADKCNRCGKVVIKHDDSDSSDMIQTGDCFLFLGDVLPHESSRPTLALKEFNNNAHHLYCPDCLVAVVTDWVKELKKRPASKIPFNHILPPGNGIFNCPLCQK
jgi:hypothetical protein